MNFLPNGNIVGKNKLLRLVVYLSLGYLAVLWVTGLLLYIEKIGFTHESVKTHYLGSEDEFKNPISYLGLLEVSHFHFFAFGFALLLLNHLMLFLPINGSVKLFLIVVSFLSGILNLGSGWLIRYVSPYFTYLKIGSFIVFYLSFFTLILLSFYAMTIYQTGKQEV